MRVVLLVLLLAGCAAAPAPAADPEPLVEGGPAFGDPWGNLTELVVLEGEVNWHDDPNAFSHVYDRVTQPVAHPCSYNGGYYFNNRLLGFASIWNHTARIEVVLEWDPLSYTRDMLRVAYSDGDAYRDSAPARSGEPIAIAVSPSMWHDEPVSPRAFGGNVGFAACPDTDTGSADVPPYFDGDLAYRVTAFKGP